MRTVGTIVGFAVLAILIERLSQRDVLRNKVVLPGSFLDRCCFARPEHLSFFQVPEALPPSGQVGIRDVDEITVEFVIPDRPSGKIFALSHESVSPPFLAHYLKETDQGGSP